MSSVVATIVVILLSISKGAIPNTIFDASDNLGRRSINDNILDILENLRIRTHLDMTKDFGVPRLDPFTVKELVLQPKSISFLEGVNVTMTNISVTGLHTFAIKEVDFNIFGLEFQLDLTVPTLILSGDYKADGLIGRLFSVKGKGPFKAQLQNVTFNSDGRLKYSNDYWSISDLSIYVGVDDFKGNFAGLSDRFVNDMLNEIGPDILKQMWPLIESSVVTVASEMIIEALSGISLPELIELLSGNGINWPPVN